MGLIFLTLVFFQAIQYNKLSEAQRLRSCPEIRSRRSTSHRDRPRPHPRTTIRAGVEETQGAEAPTKPLSSHLLGGQKCKLLHAVISSQRVYTLLWHFWCLKSAYSWASFLNLRLLTSWAPYLSVNGEGVLAIVQCSAALLTSTY